MKELADRIAIWREHPARMVRELWGVEPDPWQEDALEAFPHSPRLAMLACKGPGKTCLLAWVGWNFLLTRPHPAIGATSINADNLKANLWTELARWRSYKRPDHPLGSTLLETYFEQTKTQIFLREHPNTWKLEARSWARDADASQIGNALAGLHAPFVMWLLDESGDYPLAVLPTAEGIFAGDPKEAHIVQAGNPINRAGALFHAANTARSLWRVIEITADPDDPKRTPRVSVAHAQEQIRQFGRDNPWVLVNIFGKFPPSSINALIGDDEVKAAMKRYYREGEIGNAAKVLSVDVAREGNDASVIFRRMGIQCLPLEKHRNINSTQGAGRVARIWNDWNADGCFIDMTGGWGTGWYDQLVTLGHAPIGVQYAGQAHQQSRYYNKRAEMYFEAVEWIKRGGALPLPEGMAPEASELFQALTRTTYTFRGDRFLLQDKAQVKEILGFSPDEADAFVQTFAEPIQPRGRIAIPRSRAPVDYKPFAELDRTGGGSYDS